MSKITPKDVCILQSGFCITVRNTITYNTPLPCGKRWAFIQPSSPWMPERSLFFVVGICVSFFIRWKLFLLLLFRYIHVVVVVCETHRAYAHETLTSFKYMYTVAFGVYVKMLFIIRVEGRRDDDDDAVSGMMMVWIREIFALEHVINVNFFNVSITVFWILFSKQCSDDACVGGCVWSIVYMAE